MIEYLSQFEKEIRGSLYEKNSVKYITMHQKFGVTLITSL